MIIEIRDLSEFNKIFEVTDQTRYALYYTEVRMVLRPIKSSKNLDTFTISTPNNFNNLIKEWKGLKVKVENIHFRDDANL